MFNYDAIVVGAGLAGSVISERLASQRDMKVLIIEKEKHIGGHCYDFIDENGIITHKYGPHLFHTDYSDVWDYLSYFTEWNYYSHRVMANLDGELIPLPFSFSSLEKLFPDDYAKKIEEKLLDKYEYNTKISILDLLNESDKDLIFIANYIYQNVFLRYTEKQWGGITPDKLDSTVVARVPVLIGYDTRYFTDRFQAVPLYGYSKMIENIIRHKNINLILGLNINDAVSIKDNNIFLFGDICTIPIYFTGQIDEFFNYCFGELPYRSLKLEFKTLDKIQYQQASTINYPNSYNFTRITEFKNIHPSYSNKTKILLEYPDEYIKGVNKPYYPIFTEENKAKYNEYFNLSKNFNNLKLLGRLAEYKYYDMDDIVKEALETFKSSY